MKKQTGKKLSREHVAKTSPEIVGDRLAQLRELFPEAIIEGKVDFDQLRSALGEEVDSRPERYSFTWAGKRDAIRLLQAPSRATLVPSPKESVNFDTTGHVFIEGDNLEVLKLLYKSYFGRVKMIYIDPPYNTGNDFVYPDDFADPLDHYLKLTGQKNGNGDMLTTNPETNGRYHSAWLSMMYPRLFVARQLLQEDGLIFISIDDHEAHNLRLVMNEIFGEENFISQFVWKSRQNVDSRSLTGASNDHEYVLVYGKGDLSHIRGKEIDREKYSNPDNDPRGPWMSSPLDGIATKEQRPNLHYSFKDAATGKVYHPSPENGWRFQPSTMERLISERRVLFPKNGTSKPRFKRYLSELTNDFTGFSSVLETVFTAQGTKELRELMGCEALKFPKPSAMIKLLVEQGCSRDGIVLDFFAGSCTTAHAVMELNHADGGTRRHVMVQLPEPTEIKEFRTIADVGKERIRRVIKKMKDAKNGKLAVETRDAPEDLGFKVFKLTASNYRPWTGTEEKDPEAYAKQLALYADPLVADWKPENLLWEVAIKEGYGLTAKIEKVAGLKKSTIYSVSDADKGQSFRICLDDTLNADDVKKLNLTKDDLFICRDKALDDEKAANLALQCRLKTI